MARAIIDDPTVKLRPTQTLLDHILQLDEQSMPENIRKIYLSKHTTTKQPALFNDIIPNIKFTDSEVKILKDLNSVDPKDTAEALQSLAEEEEEASKSNVSSDHILERNDIKWLNQVLTNNRKNAAADAPKVYLHELLAGCELVLPENEILPRNPVLEERCKKLRLQQLNREYHSMTKNVDNVRRNMPEDTLAFQMKQINRHLIGVAQFLFSVAAGFAFGFIGIELIVGNLDFGFRLLLGIMIALIIALAEIYFLAKTLNEEYDIVNVDKPSLKEGVEGSKVVKESISATKAHAE